MCVGGGARGEGGIRDGFWVLAWATERLVMPFMEVGKSGGEGGLEVRMIDSAVDIYSWR